MRKLRPLLILLAVAMLAGPVLPALAIQIAQAIPHTVVADPALVTSHNMALANLTPGTSYTYQVKSCDAAGNCTMSPEATFTTAQAPATATATPAPPTATVVSTFVTSAIAAPASISPGQTTTITASVTSSHLRQALVDLEVYAPNSGGVAQRFFDNQTLVAGQSKTFAFDWTAPSGSTPGTYVIKIGVFTPGWGQLLSWNDAAGSFGVSAVPATATLPPAATRTPTPLATATRTPTALPTVTATPTPASVEVNWDCVITFDLFGVPIRMLCE